MKESGSQYNPRDLTNINGQQDRQYSPRQMETAYVGSTSQRWQTDRNTRKPPPPPLRQWNPVNTPVSRYNRSSLDHQDQSNHQDHVLTTSSGFVPHYIGQQWAPDGYNNGRRQGVRRHQGHISSYGNNHWTSTPKMVYTIEIQTPIWPMMEHWITLYFLCWTPSAKYNMILPKPSAKSCNYKIQWYVCKWPTNILWWISGILYWILKVEKVSQLTGYPSRELASAKSEGAVFKCINKLAPTTSWDDCKLALWENFSNLQTRQHLSSDLIARAQRPNETLQEWIYLIQKMKMLTGLEPQHVTDPLKINLFNRHLFNQEIKKSVMKATHRNLKDAFDAATNAKRRAKRFEGLTDDIAAVMKVNADSQKINKISVDTTNQQQWNTTQTGSMQTIRPFDLNRKKKSNNNCFKCGERANMHVNV